jgi:hypothetical protein
MDDNGNEKVENDRLFTLLAHTHVDLRDLVLVPALDIR